MLNPGGDTSPDRRRCQVKSSLLHADLWRYHSRDKPHLLSPSSRQSAGVMSVYLFMKRYSAEEMYQPNHPSFYHPRLSNCSDHSGQFLHPDAWSRGRSPSDISSEASLQMSSSYPALLKCPDYDQVSSSPC